MSIRTASLWDAIIEYSQCLLLIKIGLVPVFTTSPRIYITSTDRIYQDNFTQCLINHIRALVGKYTQT